MSNPLEIIAVLLAFLAVVLQWRQHHATWWMVLFSSALYIKIFFDAGLIWDAVLQLFFIAIALRGIFSWGAKSSAPIVHERTALFHRSLILRSTSGAAVLGLLSHLLRETPALVAFTDAAVFIFSLVAVWLTERKVISCWYYWIAIDLAAAALYFSRDLTLTAALYLAYIPLAVIGLRAWSKS